MDPGTTHVLSDVLTTNTFWGLVTGFALVNLGQFLAMVLSWTRVLPEADEGSSRNVVVYRSETFRGPIHTSIVITGFFLPIMAGIQALVLDERTDVHVELPLVGVSMILLLGGLLLGMYVAYALATISTDDDSFTIHVVDRKNVYMPALFASQMSLVVEVVCLFVWFVFTGLHP